jgi:hypothetical protein
VFAHQPKTAQIFIKEIVMPFSFRQSKIFAICLLTVSIVAATVTVARKLSAASRSSNMHNANALASVPTAPSQQNPKIEVEILTLRENGFEPKVISRPKGAFHLALNNQSQLRELLTFSMLEEKGRKLKDEKLNGGGKHRSNTLYNLSPGKYQLMVNEHPEWYCSFEITSK